MHFNLVLLAFRFTYVEQKNKFYSSNVKFIREFIFPWINLCTLRENFKLFIILNVLEGKFYVKMILCCANWSLCKFLMKFGGVLLCVHLIKSFHGEWKIYWRLLPSISYAIFLVWCPPARELPAFNLSTEITWFLTDRWNSRQSEELFIAVQTSIFVSFVKAIFSSSISTLTYATISFCFMSFSATQTFKQWYRRSAKRNKYIDSRTLKVESHKGARCCCLRKYRFRQKKKNKRKRKTFFHLWRTWLSSDCPWKYLERVSSIIHVSGTYNVIILRIIKFSTDFVPRKSKWKR